MPSGKLRLDLAALRLKSFETTAEPSGARGTVRAMDSGDTCGSCTECTWCSGCTGCTQSCGQVTFCVGSCQGTYCLNASQTDSGCPDDTWNGYCSDPCA